MPNLSFVEALEAVTDCKHLVALGDAHPDGGAHSRIHAGRRGAHVQDGHVEVALRRGRTVETEVNTTTRTRKTDVSFHSKKEIHRFMTH